MLATVPAPSARLQRAVAAERADLERHREKLLATRERLRAELAQVDDALGEVDERASLLERLVGGGGEDERQPEIAAVQPVGPAGAPLRGPAIRRAAVQVLTATPQRPEAAHYRDWYDAVRAAGHEIAGKDPLAVFLTQLGRSPVVRKGTQTGVYELDRSAPRRLRQRLDDLHEELRRLTTTPGSTVELAAIRARRAQLTVEIGQVEKALEEAEEVLDLSHALARGTTISP